MWRSDVDHAYRDAAPTALIADYFARPSATCSPGYVSLPAARTDTVSSANYFDLGDSASSPARVRERPEAFAAGGRPGTRPVADQHSRAPDPPRSTSGRAVDFLGRLRRLLDADSCASSAAGGLGLPVAAAAPRHHGDRPTPRMGSQELQSAVADLTGWTTGSPATTRPAQAQPATGSSRISVAVRRRTAPARRWRGTRRPVAVRRSPIQRAAHAVVDAAGEGEVFPDVGACQVEGRRVGEDGPGRGWPRRAGR